MKKEKTYTTAELDQMAKDFEKALKIYQDNPKVKVNGWGVYPHEGGVFVEGFEKKQWVYFIQTKPTRFEWSLWKAEKKIEYFLKEKKK